MTNGDKWVEATVKVATALRDFFGVGGPSIIVDDRFGITALHPSGGSSNTPAQVTLISLQVDSPSEEPSTVTITRPVLEALIQAMERAERLKEEGDRDAKDEG